MTARPFATWLVEHHAKADTPVGDLAREYSSDLPGSGTREELRIRLSCVAEGWALDAFDTAWADYENSGGTK